MIAGGDGKSVATPLLGIRVVDLTTTVAGPFATLVLADLGCEVMKIESPKGGDDSRRMAPVLGEGSAYFYAINRNKSSVVIDINTPEGLQDLDTLLTSADVFVTNLRSTSLKSRGLDADSLLARHRHLICADLTGYGIDGPEAARPGYDFVLQSRSGLLSINGSANSPPARVGVSILDMGAGMWLALGVIAALRRRDASGSGCRVSTSLLETGGAFLAYHLAAWQITQERPSPRGSEHPALAPYGIFHTSDGDLALGVGADSQFVRLTTVLGASELARDPRYASNALRVANRDLLRSDLETLFAARSAGAWEEALAAVDVPASTVATVDQLLSDPQLAANLLWLDVPCRNPEERELRLPGIPLRFDRVRPPLRLPPPLPGEHAIGNIKDRWADPPTGVRRGQTTIAEDADHLALIRAAVSELCSDFGEPYWQALEASSAYPDRFVQALTEAGWLSIHVPTCYGGGGMGITESSIVMEEINRSGANGSACHAQMYGLFVLLRSASKEQKETYLPAIANGQVRLQAFAVTEPDAGSDTLSIRTRAVRDMNGYVVSGQKVFTSRVQHSDLMLILARTTPPEECRRRTDGMTLFIVDLKEAGDAVRAVPIKTMINHETNTLFIDELHLPLSARIGEEGNGFHHILDALNAERILIAAECIGDARWFLERASNYARERVVFGRPIGQNQGVAFPLAHSYLQTEAASAVQQRAASAFDAGEDEGGILANAAKYLASEAAIAAGDAAMTTFGSGITSKVCRNGPSIPADPAPVTNKTSACLGLAVKKIPSRCTS